MYSTLRLFVCLFFLGFRFKDVFTSLLTQRLPEKGLYAPRAICFLISAIALPGFRPLGQARVQLRMVWQRYRLMLFSRFVLRCSLRSSRESASQR